MKKTILLSIFIALHILVNGQTVKLKITYKDFPVSQSDITIKLGDIVCGSGRTNDEGEVSINCTNLISKSIDVYGKKQTANTTKTWDLKGYVVLDGNNFAHLKMEQAAKDMSEASGGMMSESMLASMWGMTAFGRNEGSNASSGNNNSQQNNSASNSNQSTNPSTNSEKEEDDAFDAKKDLEELNQMREENMQAYKQNLENDIIRFERKIKKEEKEINDAKAEGKSQSEIRRLEIEREIDILTKEKKEIQLKETNAKIAKSELPFDERKKNELRKDEIKHQIDALKSESKNIKREANSAKAEKVEKAKNEESHSEKENEKTVEKTENKKEVEKEVSVKEDRHSDEAIQKKSKITLKTELADLKLSLKRKNLNYKIQSGSGVHEEAKLMELQKEIADLEVLISKYEKRIEELEKEKQ